MLLFVNQEQDFTPTPTSLLISTAANVRRHPNMGSHWQPPLFEFLREKIQKVQT